MERAWKIFLEHIKLHTLKDRYLDKDEEQVLLLQAVQLGLGMEEAAAFLRIHAQKHDWCLESELEKPVLRFLTHFVEREGEIRQKIFEDAALLYVQESRGICNMYQATCKIKFLIQKNQWKVKQDFLNRWFERLPS